MTEAATASGERSWRVPLASPAVRAAATVAVLVLCSLALLNLRIDCWSHVLLTRRVADEATVPSPRSVRVLSLGHRAWAAELLWSAALVYFGEAIATRSQQRFTQRYADTIEEVDPSSRGAYLWAATVSVYNGRRIRRSSIEDAIRHLRRGVQQFPDDGELIYQLGFNYYFELPAFARTLEERQQLHRQGAQLMRRAAALGHGPPWMALAAAGALESAGLTDSAVQDLRELYLRTEDERVRSQIAGRIEALQGPSRQPDPAMAELQRMDAERVALVPYVPPMLYLFVGPADSEVLERPARAADTAPAR